MLKVGWTDGGTVQWNVGWTGGKSIHQTGNNIINDDENGEGKQKNLFKSILTIPLFRTVVAKSPAYYEH